MQNVGSALSNKDLGGTAVGRSGVVEALRGLHSSSSSKAISGGAWFERGHDVETAIQLLTSLFDVLPLPHELAAALANEYARVKNTEGDSPTARRLQRAYMEVEPILASCRSHGGLSFHAQAVDVAEGILSAAAAAHGGEIELKVERGDALSPNLLGAIISSSFPNGMKFELTLRRAHRHLDAHPDAYPEGHWLLEGYVSSRAPREQMRPLEVYFGPSLPDNIGRIICASLARFTQECSASLMRLVVSNDA